MNIIFIVEDNGVQQEMVNIPVVQNIEPVNCETEDEEFTTINGKKLNLIGGKGLRNFSFSSFLSSPNKLRISDELVLCANNSPLRAYTAASSTNSSLAKLSRFSTKRSVFALFINNIENRLACWRTSK